MKGFTKELWEWQGGSYERLCPSETDWARMAAYIDGEGSILINTRVSLARPNEKAGTFYLRVTVANTDVRLLQWIKERFGGSWKDANTKEYYKGRNCKTAYHWSAASARAAWILYNCRPWFLIKQEQADLGIELQSSMVCFTRGKAKVLPYALFEKRLNLKTKLSALKQRGVASHPERSAALIN